ncbi:Wzz/FepE/Etk N-terminal domain-containing protein [Campylobacter sp. JMF_01 NE2]|uniref:Wzz/FepE/Etk N-terminal domain-containing protein n=1 Tax=unclassified Campylobacter TaxID=2593542 RepID=UPI0022E9F0E9|nr:MULTISPECIES: Wzz/FepE/Etk N-terminal domain-containing protein [unclassified Campylobacter]MDA3052016.1 Wzz/FepE/Etk N-terminal domain-containing protein [Campylobacter sp. JMF_03 NE3]MDA3066350.1 Wzz/FepE/Etk N-terminal domain-containing protein [Campylobacter sp. JMF_01 NE2]
MSENLMNSANSQNDEIDIFELLGKIWKDKFSIAMITLAFFALGVLYTIIATPWYQANARISVPYYKNISENKKELLVEADMIINKIQSKYIDALKGQPKESAFVEKIAPAKISGTKNNLSDFFDIEVMGKSNDDAVALINQIVKEEQEIYKSNISLQESRIKNALYNADAKIKTLQNSLKNSEIQISHIQNMQLPKLENRIRQIEKIFIPNKDKEIANLQNIVLPNDKKAYDELINKVIPKLDAEIQSIEKELKNPNLNQNNAIVLKERLNDLRNRYMSATTTTKQKFEHDLHDSEFVKIPNLLKDKENLLVSQTDLQNQIQTKNDDIVKIQNSIDEKKDEISKLENQKEILKASLEKQNLSNVIIKDNIIITSKSPVKPKKLLIVAIATFLGGILGVFWVLLKSEIAARKNLKA